MRVELRCCCSRFSEMQSYPKRAWDVAGPVAQTPDSQAALQLHREWLSNFQREIGRIGSSYVINGDSSSIAGHHSPLSIDHQQYPCLY